MKNLYNGEESVNFETRFKAPTAIYRDTPFWAWNNYLEPEQLKRQIAFFQQMGMGGYHTHTRTGLKTPYLGKEYMEVLKLCVEEGKKRNMLTWLYDEDRWPSGAGGGIVTRNPKFRARYLEVAFDYPRKVEHDNDDSGMLLASYLITFDNVGRIVEYRKTNPQSCPATGQKMVYVYRMVSNPDPWFNDQTAVDSLNPVAVREFIEKVYDKYAEGLQRYFGKEIPAIFTDEPQYVRQTPFNFSLTGDKAIYAYTDTMPQSYYDEYHEILWDTFPEVVWQMSRCNYSTARYQYFEHLNKLFAESFCYQIGNWCKDHNILFTGHLMFEQMLRQQIMATGGVMRCYGAFGLPGIDLLCDREEFSTAKQAQSISRQEGRGGVLSEMYGVTDWNFPFAGYKGQGDWQAALGVTVRVPHLAWQTMAGEAKRDYPASISYQSCWYKKYHLITDHFARLATAMTRGKAVVHVAVIHPIDSFKLLYGPADLTSLEQKNFEQDFENLHKWLLNGLIDFDFIDEASLPLQKVKLGNSELIIGEMKYKCILIPQCITLRSSTLKLISDFASIGGKVIFAGRLPELCDGKKSGLPQSIAQVVDRISFSCCDILRHLNEYREISVLNKSTGFFADKLLYQLRQEGEIRYLFIANSLRYGNAYTGIVKINGSWQLELLDTFTGKITEIEAEIDAKNNETVLEHDFYPHGHLLLRLTPAVKSLGSKIVRTPLDEKALEQAVVDYIDTEEIPVTLADYNPLILDQAEFKIDNGEWHPSEELLRLDNKIRRCFGMRERGGHIVQPYITQNQRIDSGSLVTLRFAITCAASANNIYLAIEQPEKFKYSLDGRQFTFNDCGYWVDESIRKSEMPDLSIGMHYLELSCLFSSDIEFENCFILGDFGVEIKGRKAVIISPVKTLHWGDITCQGLPFYGGAITYHTEFKLFDSLSAASLRFPSRQANFLPELDSPCSRREINFSVLHGTLADVEVDGKFVGDVAFAPYQIDLGALTPGNHQLNITLYCSRINTFGTLHVIGKVPYIGPGAWRSKGDGFSYDYFLWPNGIIQAPILMNF